MINQQFIRAFLLGALLVPGINIAMENNSNSDEAQEKPTFTQVCVEKSLRIAPYAIPLAVAGYYTLPRLISPVTDYVKENASYLGKNAVLMAWNSFIFYNLSQKSKERMTGNPHPDKRSCAGWLCLAPIINAAAITAASDSTVVRTAAWGTFGMSVLTAAFHDHTDLKDRAYLQKFKYVKTNFKNDTETLKVQMQSIDQCSDPIYTHTLLSRQAELIKKASAFGEYHTTLSQRRWLTDDENNDAERASTEYNHVITNKYCPLNNKVVSSDLFDSRDEKQDINEN